ncbi:ankyrin repeat domain-containing protein [uncultured Vibrio sp.]|uniref:ankyrin repeat domain-containing protein n=1 Tax=uncultured Vibrio sp. TaxID=114054 RepID=UPI0025E66E72|nr:ankyrin repeat domain-containing protein [uncultured Vibrio sp.]
MINKTLETINRVLLTIVLIMAITYGWQHVFSPRAQAVQTIQEAGYFIDRASLDEAILYGDERIAKALLNFDIDISKPNSDGYTPLMVAVEMQQPAVIDLLVAKGADLHVADFEGAYVMWYAVDGGNKKLIEQLISHGASLNKLDELQQTVLMYAASFDIDELIAYGIEAGVSPLTKDSEGDTMLHYAAYSANYEMYEWIVDEYPQLLDVKNGQGQTALDLLN